MTQEALKMALDALALVQQHLEHPLGVQMTKQQIVVEVNKVSAAIKEALAKEKTLQALHSENERLGLYKDAYAQPEQEPVAWMLTDKNINSLQVDSIQRLIDRLKHAHHTDLCVRINGQDEWFQADWLKHMARVPSPQRTWVGLTDEDVSGFVEQYWDDDNMTMRSMVRVIEAKLKERNT
jgi:hypothetical protein